MIIKHSAIYVILTDVFFNLIQCGPDCCRMLHFPLGNIRASYTVEKYKVFKPMSPDNTDSYAL